MMSVGEKLIQLLPVSFQPIEPWISTEQFVGCYDGGKLRYVAKVRAGFVSHIRLAMFPVLQQLVTNRCPFTDLPEKRRTLYSLTKDEMENCQWVKPLVVAQIEFAEWTPDGHLRHASFVGLRNDKEPQQIMRE